MQPAVSRIHALKYGTLTKQKAKYEYLTGQKDTKDMKFPGEIPGRPRCRFSKEISENWIHYPKKIYTMSI